MKTKYIEAYITMAISFGQTSESKRKKVGALIVKDGCIIAQGVNGQPPGWHTEVCEDSEGTTLPTVRHGEEAALEKIWDSTVSCKGADMFISLSPCYNCAIKIHTAGIKNVYYSEMYRCTKGIDYLLTKGINVVRVEA